MNKVTEKMGWVSTKIVLTLGLTFCGAAAVRAQDAAVVSDTLQRAIVTPDAALLPLPAEVICGPTVESVNVSPRRNYALIVRRSVFLSRDAESFIMRSGQNMAAQVEQGAPELQLLLWGPGSRRPTTIWRYAQGPTAGFAKMVSLHWLAETDTAIAAMVVVPGPVTARQLERLDYSDSPKQKTVLIRINATKGTSETLMTLDGDSYKLIPSMYEPVVVVAGQLGVSAIGIGRSVPPLRPVPLGKERNESILWGGMLPGGRLSGGLTGQDVEGKFVARQVVIDLTTGKLTDLDRSMEPTAKPIPEPPALPYTLVRDSGVLNRQETVSSVTPLWFEGSGNPKASGRGLISADSDANASFYALTTAVLYQRQGTLFATPLATMAPEAFATRRQDYFKKATLERAAVIGMTAFSYAFLHDQQLPSPGEFIRVVLERSESDLRLRNPALEQSGFTAAYTTTDMKTVAKPRETVLGYLAGPGGRAVVYFGGGSKWEDAPTP